MGIKPSTNQSGTTQANCPVEITLVATRSYADPFNQVTLDLIFTDPAGATRKVPAFWAGDKKWKVRYASPLAGVHHWRSEASDISDSGLHGMEAALEVIPYAGTNPLFQRGPVHAIPGQRYLEYGDGTPFFWLGDTWWTGLSHRLQWPKEFQRIAQDRKGKGFNVIQLVAGLYPDMHPFDPRGANEAGFPWEKNYTAIRPEYFDAVDRRLWHLVEEGFTPCVVGAWGYFLNWMGVERMKAHWRNLIARYSAWPVVWCAAGEGNLPWYLTPNFPFDDRTQVPGWTEILRFIRATDPFRRPLTIHPTAINRYTARHVTEDAALLDFDFLQTPHGQRDAVAITVRAVRESYAELPTMPVINGEPAYEMLFNRLESDWPRAMFWLCLTNGTKGHTYGANGIWQLNRANNPHGPSPHHDPGHGYGTITWEEAMRLPGSQQVAWGKKFIEQLLWTKLVPMPDTAGWAEASMTQWIQYPWSETNPQEAPERYFRRTFDLPESVSIREARLSVSPADKFTAWLNGSEFKAFPGGQRPATFDVTAGLRPGRNVLAIRTEGSGSRFISNPFAFAVSLVMTFPDGSTTVLDGNNDWRASSVEAKEWQQDDFNDSAWREVSIVQEDPLYAPQACGMGDSLRLIYALDARPVVVRALESEATYQSTLFDPVTGVSSSRVSRRTDSKGEIDFAAPSHGHDWVLLLSKIDPIGH